MCQQSPSCGNPATGATSTHHFVTPTSEDFAPIAHKIDVALGASDTIRNFVLCALLAGLVGIFEAVRSQTIQPDPSGPNKILLLAIAAAVIGGTLLAGGSGTVVGALIGAVFLGILEDGLNLQGCFAVVGAEP